MKKILLSILTIVCVCGLAAYSVTTDSTTKPSAGKMNQPPQNGRISDAPTQGKPYQKIDKKPDQKPSMKPDQKPDKMPSMKPDKKPDKQPASKPSGNKVQPKVHQSK